MVRLRFVYATGCPACDKAKKPLAEFERTHPEVQVSREDLLSTPWTESWQVTATPTYILEIPRHGRTMWVGTLKRDEIEKFIAKSMQTMGVRR